MSEHTQHRSKSKTGAASLEFNDFELQSTMQEFLKDEVKDEGKGIWNIATITGLVMLFTALTFVVSSIGLPVGEFLSDFSSGMVNAFPIIGGIMLMFVGFGFFVGDRRKERKRKKAIKKQQKAHFSDIHGSEDTQAKSSNTSFKNSLRDESTTSQKTNVFDDFGYRHAKKLMKSRTNKKIAGVCGGLARYFGISATVVRIIFVAAFFMGYGTSLLIYIGLSLAMPKEPIELMEDFDF